MSLPSMLRVFDKDNQEIAFGFTNCGWIITPWSILCSIRETMEKIGCNDDGKYYYSQENWIQKVSYIITYEIKIFKAELAFIMTGDSDEAEALLEVLMNETNR